MRIVLHDRVVDLNTGRVQGGKPLTQFECSLILYLRERTGETISRDRLLVEVWGYRAPVATRCVDSAVSRIRDKLEADPIPRYLLTVQGEGYRWWDDGETPESDGDRCLGRQSWSEQLVWAERLFGRRLQPHEPEVGISDSIRAAFKEETAQLPADSQAILDLLSLARLGWTPTELAHHADPAALRLLVHHKWVVVEGSRTRLHDLWWPVRHKGQRARVTAATLWGARLKSELRLDFLEILEVFTWPEVPAEQAGELLVLATDALELVGLRQQFLSVCNAVMNRGVSHRTECRLLLARTKIRRSIGLMQEALGDARAAATQTALHAPDLQAEAVGEVAWLSVQKGDCAAAAEHFARAIELAHAQPELRFALMSRYAGLLRILGNTVEAKQMMGRALALARHTGWPEVVLEAENAMAAMLLEEGDVNEAVSRFERVRRAAAPAHAVIFCSATLLMAMAHIELRRFEEAASLVEAAEQHATATQEFWNVAGVSSTRGRLAAAQGHWAEAKAAFLNAISTYQDAQVGQLAFHEHCWGAVAAHRLGQDGLAQTMLASALELHGPSSSTPRTAVLAMACEALGVAGPAYPEQVLPASSTVRLARRVFGIAERSDTPE
jgi:DNA-binding winged helix-turn-helix (wHTH) protein/tetratricopeptide (TPR) repeat protein